MKHFLFIVGVLVSTMANEAHAVEGFAEVQALVSSSFLAEKIAQLNSSEEDPLRSSEDPTFKLLKIEYNGSRCPSVCSGVMTVVLQSRRDGSLRRLWVYSLHQDREVTYQSSRWVAVDQAP